MEATQHVSSGILKKMVCDLYFSWVLMMFELLNYIFVGGFGGWSTRGCFL